MWSMTTYSAVVTTGIYCRPGCAARPLAPNVQTLASAIAALAVGREIPEVSDFVAFRLGQRDAFPSGFSPLGVSSPSALTWPA